MQDSVQGRQVVRVDGGIAGQVDVLDIEDDLFARMCVREAEHLAQTFREPVGHEVVL